MRLVSEGTGWSDLFTRRAWELESGDHYRFDFLPPHGGAVEAWSSCTFRVSTQALKELEGRSLGAFSPPTQPLTSKPQLLDYGGRDREDCSIAG